MAIWRKASDPGDPAGDVQWGGGKHRLPRVAGGGKQEGEIAFNRTHPDR